MAVLFTGLNWLQMVAFQTDDIFKVRKDNFSALALDIFRFQYANNPVYRQYTDLLQVDPAQVQQLTQIPFLPISLFKTHDIRTTVFEPVAIFESSGTTQTINSRHAVKDIELYTRSFMQAFERFYGRVEDWCIIGLLPAYLERPGSSLVVMTDGLIRKSAHPNSGFYLYDYEKLHHTLMQLEAADQKTLLIGVTFALLDLSEQYPMKLNYTTIMETGGMKGRRKEMVRQELHALLSDRFGVSAIHSEYGMTELLSQAYSKGDGLFEAAPWMRVLVRQEDDPLVISDQGSGIINIIDLANVYSCSFIATDDVGHVFDNGFFEISGRVDNSDIRGCSLLVM